MLRIRFVLATAVAALAACTIALLPTGTHGTTTTTADAATVQPAGNAQWG